MRFPHPSARLGIAFLWTANATLSRSRSFKKGWGRIGFFSSLQTTQKGKDSLPRVLKQPSATRKLVS